MTASATESNISALNLQLTTGSEKVQQQVIQKLANLGDAGWDVLIEFLLRRQSDPPTWIDGKAYQALYCIDSPLVRASLQTHFPNGIVPLRSEYGIDYTQLQQLLTAQDFQAADRTTIQKLCELAGPAAVQRKWLYFTEVGSLPNMDLQTINTLWLVHSEGKFGFSVQREIWLSLGKKLGEILAPDWLEKRQ